MILYHTIYTIRFFEHNAVICVNVITQNLSLGQAKMITIQNMNTIQKLWFGLLSKHMYTLSVAIYVCSQTIHMQGYEGIYNNCNSGRWLRCSLNAPMFPFKCNCKDWKLFLKWWGDDVLFNTYLSEVYHLEKYVKNMMHEQK